MDELVRWLGEQLDIDAAAAHEAIEQVGNGRWQQRNARIVTVADRDREVADFVVHECIDHIARWDPARVLREIDAKRRVFKMADEATRQSESRDYLINGPAKMMLACLKPVLLHLASVYADRPGYREEWRP